MSSSSILFMHQSGIVVAYSLFDQETDPSFSILEGKPEFLQWQ